MLENNNFVRRRYRCMLNDFRRMREKYSRVRRKNEHLQKRYRRMLNDFKRTLNNFEQIRF